MCAFVPEAAITLGLIEFAHQQMYCTCLLAPGHLYSEQLTFVLERGSGTKEHKAIIKSIKLIIYVLIDGINYQSSSMLSVVGH